MSEWVPVLPSLRATSYLARYDAVPGEPFTCPICFGESATLTHSPPDWPVFKCPTCPNVPTIHDLVAKWPVLENDCDRSVEANAGTIVPRDPAFSPPVTVLSLGYDENGYYYYQNSITGHIMGIKARDHVEGTLIGITPDFRYWYWAYGKEGEAVVDWKKAARAMVAECQIKGRFRLEDMRGGGVWLDRGRIVANLGTHLLVDGVETKIQGFDSTYIYDAMIRSVKLPPPMTPAEAHRIAKILWHLPFTDGTGPISLGGMIVVGPLCGILSWRPHLWLTGAAESGKSTILKYVLSRIWKPTGAAITDESTSAAGIRQRALKHSAIPVVMDESEADDAYGAQRVKAVVKMARSSSSDSDATVYKGTQGGSGMEFNVRSCFVLCSIVESLTTPQDRQRFTVVQCAKSERSVKGWPQLKRDMEDCITPETGLAMYSAIIRDAKIIQENIRRASAHVFILMGQDSRRHSDQLGSFIAGYHYLLKMGTLITDAEVAELYYKMNYADIKKEIEQEDDTPVRCLNKIYSFRPVGQTLTLGECVDALIAQAARGVSGLMEDDWKSHRSMLKRMGLDVEAEPGGGCYLHVAVKHPELTYMLESNGFASHSKLLRRLPGARSGKTVRFGRVQSHTVMIPLSDVEDDTPEADADKTGTHSIEELFGAAPSEAGEDW